MKKIIKLYLLLITIYGLGLFMAFRVSRHRRALKNHHLTAEELTHSYKQFKVFRLKNVSEDSLELLIQLVEGYQDEGQTAESNMQRNIVPAVFWNEFYVAGDPVDVLISPTRVKSFKQDLRKIGIDKAQILVRDLMDLMEQQDWSPSIVSPFHNLTWRAFHESSDFYKFYNYLEEKYPDLVQVQDIGLTYNNERLVVVKVCSMFCDNNRPSVWVDAGIHGNEWIGPATASYILKELVENSVDHLDMLTNFQWYFLPIFNPDGYAITMSNDSFRLWHKNRSPLSESEDCIGVDLNQNFLHVEIDPNLIYPCSDVYQGRASHSEMEVQNVVQFLTGKNVKIFVTMHSFGNTLLLPWKCGEEPPHPDGGGKIIKIAEESVAGLNDIHGSEFRVSCISSFASGDIGGSWVWAKRTGIPYAYALNLRDTGPQGVFVSPKQIVASGEEAFNFFKALSKTVSNDIRDEG